MMSDGFYASLGAVVVDGTAGVDATAATLESGNELRVTELSREKVKDFL